MPPLRVCHLGKYYAPASGGIETHVRTLARAQAALGLDVKVYCLNHVSGTSTTTEDDGPIEVTRFGRRASVARLDLCPGLTAALDELEADVLHLQVPNPTMILALLRSRTRLPLVITYQSDVVKQQLRAALFRPLERLLYRRAAAILPTSPTYAAGSRFLRPYRDRTRVLPMGIDLDPYLEPSERDRAAAGRIRREHPGPLWLGCGRLIYYKGFPVAVRALTRVAGTLLLVGDGPERGGAGGRGQGPGRGRPGGLPRAQALPGDRAVLPRGRRLLVPLGRALRGVRDRPGGGDGRGLPGHQHGDPRQRRGLGLAP